MSARRHANRSDAAERWRPGPWGSGRALDRADRRDRVATRVPAASAGPRRRLYVGRGGGPAAVRPVPARRVSGPDHGIGKEHLRPAVVARRAPPRVHPRQRAPCRRGRRVAGRPRDRPPGGRLIAPLGTRRPAARLHLPPAGLVAGLDRGRARASSRAARSGPATPGTAASVGDGDRCRGSELVGRRPIDRRDGHSCAGSFGRRDSCDRHRVGRGATDRGWRRGMGERSAPDAGRGMALRIGRGRLVPDRPSIGGWPRAPRPHERRAGTWGAVGRSRIRGPCIA